MNTSLNTPNKPVTFSASMSQEEILIYQTINPESDLERLIIQQPEWIKGAFWGEPRPGHPEGNVIHHIGEVLANINKVTENPKMRERLRLIAIIHDTFKYMEEQVRPRKDWSKHHSIYAMRFAQKFIQDQAVIDVIELHDEAYYAWCALTYHFSFEHAFGRMERLYDRIGNHMQLYYLFFKCDTQTGDKTQKPVKWFEETVPDIQAVNF